MENVSTMTEPSRYPVCIEIKPYMADHRFMGQSVLPAVEIMRLLAFQLRSQYPWIDIFSLKHASFSKFIKLPLTSELNYIDAFIDIELTDTHAMKASLVTRFKSKSGSMTRSITHASMCFQEPDMMDSIISFEQPDISKQSFYETGADVIYHDLIPFGPAFHNLTGTLKLSEHYAIGKVKSGSTAIEQTGFNGLGSCFPLDAAFHAACVWGQRYEGVIAFPMGFDHRKIYKPTCPESIYNVCVRPLKKEADTLFFDLWLYDDSMRIFEKVNGLMMKDATGGQMLPPQWIMKHKGLGKI